MNFDDLKKAGFEQWFPLNKLTVSDLLNTKEAVYVFRSQKAQEMRKGSSDILYIGSTGNLLRRIFSNYLGGVGGETTQRIHGLLFSKNLEQIEISWVASENFAKLEEYVEGISWPSSKKHKELEKRLKLKFEREHGQYPAWNECL